VAKNFGARPGEHVIDDDFRDNDPLFPPGKGRGMTGRDFGASPPEMYEPPAGIEVIPESEWADRANEIQKTESGVSHILLGGDAGQPIPSLDQGPVGYCWAHSTVGALQAVRALKFMPYVPLSAYAVAATIKNGRDEGGWCGLSGKFVNDRGVPSQKLWPQGDRNYRTHDTPEVWADAAKHKMTESWMDLARPAYDQVLTWQQVVTCLLLRIPVAADFNWWGHSVLLCDVVVVEGGSIGIRMRNSWGDGWGDRGFSILRGAKARPDNALAIRSATVAV
jgi:hypothetical protein